MPDAYENASPRDKKQPKCVRVVYLLRALPGPTCPGIQGILPNSPFQHAQNSRSNDLLQRAVGQIHSAAVDAFRRRV
ncbi:hypothetical protein SVEN_4048 [Streptomyces venezuelae ATCC 10712]|uniref:Uncharacterized protein n=1 Tax=Streptomyces venezuelae (strain ATCC 10712 / CBS 650.69 / DSM 40230 / JCM 4526 / NBRC 13096 / PD 04745) TaxID=953739 RepID=F2RH06_STRVP|nr:hypothetical protein SVEN_4048 [Streptomyces venezuelae ATCC 10712]